MEGDKSLAEIIWNYLKLDSVPEQSNVIVLLSSLDPRVAEYAATLWKEKYAPLVLVCGTGIGHKDDLLASNFGDQTEAEFFAGILGDNGVPDSAIIIEKESQNTGENARYGHKKLAELGIKANKILVVTKPYMGRRAFSTFKKQWPDDETEIAVVAPQIPFSKYFNNDQPFDKIVNIMIGDLQRIIKYPKQGFQIEQEVPENVHDAMNELIRRGYNKHLLSSHR